MLRLSALLGIGGIGMSADTVSATSACGETGEDPGSVDSYWELGDDGEPQDGCDRAALRGQRLLHGASTEYLGSLEKTSEEWAHFFLISGHSEYFRGGYSCDSWEHSPGVRRHKVTIENEKNYPKDALKNANKYDVSGTPAAGSNNGELGDIEKKIASTALTTAISFMSNAALAAGASIALALLGRSESRFDETEPTFEYEWDYGSGSYKCGSHVVDTGIEGGKRPSITVIDESWGEYPLYHAVEMNVDLVNPKTGSVEDHPNPGVSEGDTVESTSGEQIRVTETKTESRQVGEYESTVVSSNDQLPRRLSRKLDSGEEVRRFVNFPARVQTTSVSGRLID